MFKGYNHHCSSFSDLQTAIRERSEARDGKDYFKVSYLHHLPPLIMVFSAEALDKLAKANNSTRLEPTYKQLYKTILNQVESFVCVGKHRYSFILEIGHSGLGLGYDSQTGRAKNPLDGDPIRDKRVIYESLLGRALVDVSLYLRGLYPELLFASCTRLPDTILPEDKKYKVRYATANLEEWKTGEHAISSKLRAIHGGLYPQSHIAIADDPVAEIAAHTWIDQTAKLTRKELLKTSYDTWLKKGGNDLVEAMKHINGDLLNRVDDLPDQSDMAKPRGTTIVPARNNQFWPLSIAAPDASVDWSTALADNPTLEDEEDVSDKIAVSGRHRGDEFNPHVGMFDPSGYLTILPHGPNYGESILSTEDGDYTFYGIQTALGNSNSMCIYDRVNEIGLNELRNLIKYGANINAWSGPDGTPLAAACGSARPSAAKLVILLEHGASVDIEGQFGYPL